MQDPHVPELEPEPLPRPQLGPAWREGPLERVRRFAGDPRVGAIALVLVALGAGVAWYRADTAGDARTSASSPAATDARTTGASGSSRPPSSGTQTSPVAASSEVATGSGTTTGSRAANIVLVHVAGAVVHPGVVQLKAGSRVIDALEAVGGGVPGADLDRLNLAAKLTDGERVAVPKIGEQPPAEIPNGAAAGAGITSVPTSDAPLDLNSATPAQLDELPGIGPSLAASIVAERTKRGGFGSVNDLRSVRGIGDGRFADLAPLVHVG